MMLDGDVKSYGKVTQYILSVQSLGTVTRTSTSLIPLLIDTCPYVIPESFLVSDTIKSWQALEKRCEDLKLLQCLIRPSGPSLRHEKRRSFLFTRLDLLNRTDPDEAVRNADYSMY